MVRPRALARGKEMDTSAVWIGTGSYFDEHCIRPRHPGQSRRRGSGPAHRILPG